MDNKSSNFVNAVSGLQKLDDRKRIKDNLSEYLDIIQEFLTFAEELPPKKREELLEIIDKMLDNYKALEESMQKATEAEKWQRVRQQ